MLLSLQRPSSPGPGSRRTILGRLALLGATIVALDFVASLLLSTKWFWRSVYGESDVYHRLEWVEQHAGRPHAQLDRQDVYDPERGWALRPNLRDFPAFEGKTVSSNSHGVRGIREYAYAKSPDVTRIVTIGDSFTFGDEVNDDETYSSFLERSLPGVEVINLGVHGYGHDQMLLHLRREGIKYHPDVVVVGFVGADAVRNALSFRDYAKPRFHLTPRGLNLRNVPVPAPDVILAQGRRFALIELTALLASNLRAGPSADDANDMLTRALLAAIVQTIRDAEAKPVVLHIATAPELGHDPPDIVRQLCTDTQIVCAFTAEALARARDAGMVVEYRSHYTPDAHRVVAGLLRRRLIDAGLVAAPSADAGQ